LNLWKLVKPKLGLENRISFDQILGAYVLQFLFSNTMTSRALLVENYSANH